MMTELNSFRWAGPNRHLSLHPAGSELHRLCRSGDLSAIRSYLNETLTETVVNRAAGVNGCTPLHEAAMAGRADVVRLLNEECEFLDINVRTQRGPAFTPLHLAAERGHVETVIALIDCGASLVAVDRRCRTAKDIAMEKGHGQVVIAITTGEVEKATENGNVLKLTEALSQLIRHTKLTEEVAVWKQEKLNSSLQIACKLGQHRLATPLIKAGAENFKECIENSTCMNHIMAFLRLCQAAQDDDHTAIDLLLSWDEESVYLHPLYPSLMQYNNILMPLIENGTLSVGVPIKVAIKYKNTHAVTKLLSKTSKTPEPASIDWHHLELENVEPEWLKQYDYSTLSLICLSFNSLKEIPAEILKFRNLTKLQIASNELTFVPASLFCMEQIKNIDLSHNQITSLPENLMGPVSDSLQVLNIAHNQLSSLPDYLTVSRLTKLDISNNHFQEVPISIAGLRYLESLDISHNTEIMHVPYELGGLKHLVVLSLENIHANNIPDNHQCSVLKFLQDRFKSMQTVVHYEVQVIGFPKQTKALEGVIKILTTSELDCSVLKFSSPSQFLFLHEVFKMPNVLYVIPWDCHNKQEANDLHLVLRHLSVHSSQSPVIVVACWKSILYAHSELTVENQIAESLWKDLSDNIHLHHVLLEGGESVVETGGETSVKMFLNAVNMAAKRITATSFVPCSYYNCHKLLKTESQKMQHENRSLFMSAWDFWELIRSMPSHDLSSHCELPELVKFLSSMTTLVHLPSSKESESYYVLDRQWYCQVLGNIISQNSFLMASSTSAVVRQEGLVDLLGISSIQLPIPSALQFALNRNGISLALSSERWFLPSMLNTLPDLIFTNFSTDDIRRQYTCTIVPITLIGRLIAHLRINMESLIKHISFVSSGSLDSVPTAIDWRYWRGGIVCWMNACDLVYSIECIEINTEPFHQGIEIRVANTKFGHITMQLLTLTIDSLLKNWYPTLWKTVEVWVPCSYCIHTQKPDIPSISFQDCLFALSKGVGVKCVQHMEKIVKIAKIVPDLIEEDTNSDLFIPPSSISFNLSDKASCLSSPPTETIFKGQYQNSLVAVKPYPSPVPNTKGKDPNLFKSTPVLEMWTEFEVLLHLQNAKCPFILNLMGMTPQPLCLVFPFAKWSSLEEVISVKQISVPRIVRLQMVHQLARALEAVHSYHVIHRNVSLANILVYSLSPDDEVNIKLAGFSDACYGLNQGIGVGCYGTFPAPEMLRISASEYDERVDIFAFAFVAYEIITRSMVHVRSNSPFKKPNDCLTSNDRPSLNPVRNRAPYLCELLTKCWHPDPFKRPYANKIVECLRTPLHSLVHDGTLINEKHELYAAAAKFTRVKNSFHTDVFVCSGELTAQCTTYLTHLSLPDLDINRTVELPSEFVICMGCIGSQLWVSFSGRKVRVYSTLGKLDFINEFSFDHHVVAIGVSPTFVYLGLENGVLHIYDFKDKNTPTEPRSTKVISQGEDFKCIEPLEAYVMCATGKTVYRLHPDTLNIEAYIPITARADIRSIAISEPGYEDDQQPDTIWVSFKRTDQIQVLNSWTGQLLYTISCATIISMNPNKVWVYSLRVVLDTIWIGLNTGHVLIFAAVSASPRLISYLHIHCCDVRQLLLLHPSYMGNMTVLSASEMLNASLTKSPTGTLFSGSLLTPTVSPTVPDSVLVLSMGIGLRKDLPNVRQCIEEGYKDSVKTTGLYAAVLEGMAESRLESIEILSCREPIAYMKGCDENYIYDVPPVEDSLDEELVMRADTWSADMVESPIYAKIRTLPRREDPPTLKENNTAPPLPPRPEDLLPSQPNTPQRSKRKFLTLFSRKPKHTETVPQRNKGNISLNSKDSIPPSKSAKAPQADTDDPIDSLDYDYPTHKIWSIPQPQKSHVGDLRHNTIHTAAMPILEDSAPFQDYDPYVEMGAVQTALRQRTTPAPRMNWKTVGGLSEDEDFVTTDEFLRVKPLPSLPLEKSSSSSNESMSPTLPPKSVNQPPKPVKLPILPKPTKVPQIPPKPANLVTSDSSGVIRSQTIYSDIQVRQSNETGVRDSVIDKVAYVTVRRHPT